MSNELSLCEGKYTFYLDEHGSLFCKRYGEPWRDFIGDKAVHALFGFATEIKTAKDGIVADVKAKSWITNEPFDRGTAAIRVEHLLAILNARLGGK